MSASIDKSNILENGNGYFIIITAINLLRYHYDEYLCGLLMLR